MRDGTLHGKNGFVSKVSKNLVRCRQGWNDLNQLIKTSDLNHEFD